MSSRKAKIEKIKLVRERELDKRLGELAACQRAEELARQAAELERSAVEKASESRLRLCSSAVEVQALSDADEWLVMRAKKLRLAEHQAERAELARAQAQAEVLKARTELKKLQMLAERLAEQERMTAARAERRLEDELCAISSAARDNTNRQHGT